MPQHLRSFVASFTDGTEQQKTSMIEQLVADWLRAEGNPIPINHTMCLVELLQWAEAPWPAALWSSSHAAG